MTGEWGSGGFDDPAELLSLPPARRLRMGSGVAYLLRTFACLSLTLSPLLD